MNGSSTEIHSKAKAKEKGIVVKAKEKAKARANGIPPAKAKAMKKVKPKVALHPEQPTLQKETLPRLLLPMLLLLSHRAAPSTVTSSLPDSNGPMIHGGRNLGTITPIGTHLMTRVPQHGGQITQPMMITIGMALPTIGMGTLS